MGSEMCIRDRAEDVSSLTAEFPNLYFGVGPLSVRQNFNRHKARLRAVPLERILLETDAPYMATAPTKVRGLLDRVARVRQLPVLPHLL